MCDRIGHVDTPNAIGLMEAPDVTATFQRLETKIDTLTSQSMVSQTRLDAMEKSIDRLSDRTERRPVGWPAIIGAIVPIVTLFLALAALWYLGPTK